MITIIIFHSSKFFITLYVISPGMNIYNSVYNFVDSYINDPNEKYLELNLENKTIKLSFTCKGRKYKILSNIIDDNFKNVCDRIHEDLQKNIPIRRYLSATINDEIDVTELINQYSGPFGDFYHRYGFTMTLDLILPINLKKDFESLKLIDDLAEMYEFNYLNKPLQIGYDLTWFSKLSSLEKKKCINDSLYI